MLLEKLTGGLFEKKQSALATLLLKTIETQRHTTAKKNEQAKLEKILEDINVAIKNQNFDEAEMLAK